MPILFLYPVDHDHHENHHSCICESTFTPVLADNFGMDEHIGIASLTNHLTNLLDALRATPQAWGSAPNVFVPAAHVAHKNSTDLAFAGVEDESVAVTTLPLGQRWVYCTGYNVKMPSSNPLVASNPSRCP
jgi:hypothetical protein